MDRTAKIGLFFLTGILAIYLTISWLSGGNLSVARHSEHVARFSNVSGLKSGDPILLYGIQVGSVIDIRPGAGYATVTITLLEDIDLRADAELTVGIREVLGGKQLLLNPGQRREALPAGQFLKGNWSTDFPELTATLGGYFQALPPQNVNRMAQSIDSLARALNALMPAVAQAFTGLEQAQLLPKLQQTLAGTQQLLGQLVESGMLSQMPQLLQQTHATLQQSQHAMQSFQTLAPQMARTLAVADTATIHFIALAQNSQALLAGLQPLLNALSSDSSAVRLWLTQPNPLGQIQETMQKLNETLEILNAGQLRIRAKFGGL